MYIWYSGASSCSSELKASPTIEIRPLSDWQLTSTLGSPIRHDKKFEKSISILIPTTGRLKKAGSAAEDRNLILIVSLISSRIHCTVIIFTECNHHDKFYLVLFGYHLFSANIMTINRIEIKKNEFIQINFRASAVSCQL